MVLSTSQRLTARAGMVRSPSNKQEPIIYIVDDNAAVCQAVETMVKTMNLNAQGYTSAKEFLEAYDPTRPGCVLLDIRIGEVSGLELLERLMQEQLRLPAIIISAHGDVPTAVRAMKAGALNFLEKPCREQQLWEAIQEALKWDAGHRRIAVRVERMRKRIARLNAGECDVLELLVKGRANRTIAARLNLSVRTIEVRRSKLMKKMKASSLAELVQMHVIANHSPLDD